MAKKKEASASPFVPEGEQPYPIPENWCWVRLQSISKLFNGDRGTNYPSKKDYVSFGIPFINAGAIIDYELDYNQFNYITREKYNSLRAGKIQQGDILYCLRGSLGKTAIVKENIVGAISSSLCIIRVEPSIEKKYMYFLLTSDAIIKQQGQAENGSAQPNLSAASVMAYSVPLPPLSEQRRIVSLIESLFAKLDEAREKAQAVVDGFELRKSAILHKAFTGELTERWRKEHGVGIKSWRKRYLEDICQYMKAGGDKPDDFSECEDSEHCIPVVANGIAQDGIIGYTKEAKYAAGTVTVSGRGTIGYSIYRDYPIYPVVRLIVLCPIADVLPEFLKYVFDAYPEEGTGSSIPQLTVPSIKKKNIPFPTQEEQTRIIEILNNIFSKEQQAKSAAEAVLSQIDAMKKAILARAFRGELGTNDPAEAWAGELLKNLPRKGA